jgi:LysM repeat protein
MQLIGHFFFTTRQMVGVGMLIVLTSSWGGGAYGDTPGTRTTTTVAAQSREQQTSSADTPPPLRHSADSAVQDVPFLGTIVHTVGAEPRLVRLGEQAVIDAGADADLQVGDRLTIFRVTSQPQTPYTDTKASQRVRPLGTATVVQTLSETSVIEISEVMGEIAVGDRFQKLSVRPRPVSSHTAAPASTPSGAIVASPEDKILLATGDIVYLNQGAEHGVQRGDHFLVFEQPHTVRDPDTHRVLALPQQTIGALTIIDIQESTSTALVASSIRELPIGSPVQYVAMRQSRQEPAGRMAAVASPDHRATQELITQVSPCFEKTRQAIQAAEANGAGPQGLAVAKNTLAYATTTWQQAQELLAQGQQAQAAHLREMSQSDCLTAYHLANQTGLQVAKAAVAPSDGYTVQNGDTLWDIAARPTIYHDRWLWPLLYKANRHHIGDPDLIFPQQVLTVPRDASPTETTTAAQRARTRGPWHIGDGPDTYILDGTRP